MRLDYNITDRCNLNCASCVAYSPLAKNSTHKSLDQIKSDFKKIYELTLNGKEIRVLSIVGGEPLLHPEINEVIVYIATLFKDTRIKLITNGILIPKMNNEFFDIIKKYVGHFCITEYPININYEKIIELLEKKNIQYYRYNYRVSGKNGDPLFNHQYLKDEYDENYEEIHSNCRYGFSKDFFVLRDNKLYPCNQRAYFDYFDKKFKGKHNIKVSKKDYIDLDEIESFNDLKKALHIDPPFCGYCLGSENFESTKWTISKGDINEWLKPK